MKSLLGFIIIVVSVFVLSLSPNAGNAKKYHSLKELNHYRYQFRDIVDPSLYFATSAHCKGCHGFDDERLSLIDLDSNDVNIYDDWSASMMAQSAKDPFWRAKVTHESISSPAHTDAIQTKCTSCHAPMGQYQKRYEGHETYTLEDLLIDTMGLDGVSCAACHQLDKTMLGETFSGDLHFDTSRTLFGPYPLPFLGPMRDFVGFEPKFSDHVFLSEMCASCHTLVTETIAPDGQITGDEFIEQATYHEWLNSTYAVEGINCQTCHMPYLDDGVVISSGYSELVRRFPFALHQMTGANSMMLDLMNRFKDTLGIDVKSSAFLESIEATKNLLQSSVELSILSSELKDDSLIVEINLINKAGHKFPSGYPARRAWIECIATSHTGDTLFHSGKLDTTYRLIDRDAGYEPHHETITTDDQVQIYEMVSVDVNLEPTTILTRAFKSVKDNRLVPTGFRTDHAVYDTTLIVGKALSDQDFNFFGDQEGSGSDAITYKIDVSDFDGVFDVHFNVWYQSIPPEWTDELFSVSDPTIDLFKSLYDSIKAVPEFIAKVSLDSIAHTTTAVNDLSINKGYFLFPNPTTGHRIYIKGIEQLNVQMEIRLTNLFGQHVFTQQLFDNSVELPQSIRNGTYVVSLYQDGQLIYTTKLILME